jgi:DNA invertase Pin-like site-specific DNA recombinase
MKKVAIYVRVSTRDKQDVSKQRDFLLDFINRNSELQVYGVFEDVGISGSKQQRPALDEMLSKIDQYNIVLVYKIDRIGRSFRNLFDLLDLFKKNNIDFISATQPIDTTKPEGRLFFNMLSSFAEFEREMIVQRINDGLDIARSRGRKLGRKKGSKDKKKREKIGYYVGWKKRKDKIITSTLFTGKYQ